MSQTWFLYTPLSPRDALAVETDCHAELRRFLDEHPDNDDPVGELSPGGPLPTRDEAVAAHARYRLPLTDSTVARLAACRSSLAIDRPQGGRTRDGEFIDVSPLQLSMLRHLLRRIGKGLILFNDYPLLHSDIVLLELRLLAGAEGFSE